MSASLASPLTAMTGGAPPRHGASGLRVGTGVAEAHSAEKPSLRDALLETARANQRLGGYFTGVIEHYLPRTTEHHDAALRALEERASLDPADAVAQRNVADQLGMKATAQNMMKDGAGAHESTDRALTMLTPLAAADPKNAEAQRDLAFAHGERGRALNMLDRAWRRTRPIRRTSASSTNCELSTGASSIGLYDATRFGGNA